MSSVLVHLASVHWTALAVAIALQIAKLLVRSRAWHNLLRAAFPGARLSWPATAGAVFVSAGVNSAAPARLGDVVKVAVVRRGLAGRCCLPTIGATMVAEAALDAAQDRPHPRPRGAAADLPGCHPRDRRARRGRAMKLELDTDACQGHARCLALAPDLFDLDATGYAVLLVATVPPGLEAAAREAAAACPERAIVLEP